MNKCIRNSNIDDGLHPHRQRVANTLVTCKSEANASSQQVDQK